MRRLVVATTNSGKALEIAVVLCDLPVDVVSLRDYPGYPDVPETGSTFAENAIIKASHASKFTGELTLADDSGLVVDALDGQPGVYSSRFAGEGATDEDRNARILSLLKDVPEEKRTARFISAIAIADGDNVQAVEGTCEGCISLEPHGTGGFGYDPIFYVPMLRKTMAELTRNEKNAISHRGRALAKARELIEKALAVTSPGRED